jgi:sec-independent protein translocase protein TatB
MFNIGFGELAIICIVLIIAVGPERLPTMMKTLGKTLRTLRQATRDIRASTGIDELLREDFDLYTPPAPRRPAAIPPLVPPAPPEPAEPALQLPNGEVTGEDPLGAPVVAAAPASLVAAEPRPISREDVIPADPQPPAPVFVPAPAPASAPEAAKSISREDVLPLTPPVTMPPTVIIGGESPAQPLGDRASQPPPTSRDDPKPHGN